MVPEIMGVPNRGAIAEPSPEQEKRHLDSS
jgi:hypothetical protein